MSRTVADDGADTGSGREMVMMESDVWNLKYRRQALIIFMSGMDPSVIDPENKLCKKRKMNNFVLHEGMLLRKTPKGIRTVAEIQLRPRIPATFHDYIVPWSLPAAKQFMLDR